MTPAEEKTVRQSVARDVMRYLNGMCEHWEHPDDPAGLWMIIVHGGDTERGEDWDEAFLEARAIE